MAKESSVWEFDDQVFDFSTQQKPKITDEEIKVFRDITFNIRHPDGKRDIPWPNDCVPQEEKLGQDLAIQYVYEWESGNTWTKCYEVEVNAFIGIKYNLSFEECENYDIQSAFPLNQNSLSVDLQPFEREIICMISTNKQKESQYTVKGDWAKCQIHPQLYQQSIIIANNKIKAEYAACLKAGCNESVSSDKMADIVRTNGLLFVDGDMFPDNDALFILGDEDENAKQMKNDKNLTNYIQWRRAGDFIKGWPMIFKNGILNKESINPLIPRMGNADDAWLISVISVLSLRTDLIANLFISKDGTSDPSKNVEDKMFGFYRMQICSNGIWKECIMDDLFPCQPYWLPVMSDCSDNDQIWPHLIEKLVSKMRGNCYESLDHGSPSEAFADLTGCPIETYNLREYDTDIIFEKLNASYSAAAYNVLAVVICDEDGDQIDLKDKLGLLSQHSYSVLNISMQHQLICLRDPFGRAHNIFQGEYNKDSNAWTGNNLSNKDVGGYDQGGDGIIYVTFQEFIDNFTTIFMCIVADNYTKNYSARQTIDISYDPDTRLVSVPVLKLTVPDNGKVDWLGLSQKGLIRNSRDNQLKPLDLCLFILSANGNKLDIDTDEAVGYIPMSTARNKFVEFGADEEAVEQNDISSTMSWKNSNELSNGNYWVIPWTSGSQWESDIKDNDNDNAQTRYIGLTVHGSGISDNNKFELQPCDGFTGNDIDDIFKLFAFKYGEKKQWKDLERRHFQMGQLDIYCAKNECNDKNINVNMTATEMTNVNNVNGYHDFKVNQEKKFKVECGKSNILAVQVPSDPNESYSLCYKYSFKNQYL